MGVCAVVCGTAQRSKMHSALQRWVVKGESQEPPHRRAVCLCSLVVRTETPKQPMLQGTQHTRAAEAAGDTRVD